MRRIIAAAILAATAVLGATAAAHAASAHTLADGTPTVVGCCKG